MRHIVAATDLSERPDSTLQRAVQLAAVHSGVRVVHDVDAQRNGAASGLSLVFTFEPARPSRRSRRPRRMVGPILIVLGPHRRRLLADIFTGTMVERLIRRCRVPVLMASEAGSAPYSNVIAAVDISDAAGAALKAAHALGMLTSARVMVVHAVVPTIRMMMSHAGIERQRIEKGVSLELEEARRNLIRFVDALALEDLRFDLRLHEGQPGEVIRRAADREAPDLVVVSTRGLTGLWRLLLGSVAHELTAEVETDILVAPIRVRRQP